MYVYLNMHTMCITGASGSQKRTLDHLVLELQAGTRVIDSF